LLARAPIALNFRVAREKSFFLAAAPSAFTTRASAQARTNGFTTARGSDAGHVSGVARSQTQIAAAIPVAGVWAHAASTHASRVHGSPSSHAASGAQVPDVRVVLVVAPVTDVLLVVGGIVGAGVVDVLDEVLLDEELVEVVDEVVVGSQMVSVGARHWASSLPGLTHRSPMVHGSPSSQSALLLQTGPVPPPGGPMGSAPAGAPLRRRRLSVMMAAQTPGT
jgi:hypothetical protein